MLRRYQVSSKPTVAMVRDELVTVPDDAEIVEAFVLLGRIVFVLEREVD